MAPNKFALYERAVQTPEVHAAWFRGVFRELRGFEARSLREDFCGTFRISCEWVKLNPKNRSLCIDLDDDSLDFGKKNNLSALSTSARKRIQILQQDVRKVTTPKSDLAIACNFSFNIFKERENLLNYFKKVRGSLANKGAFLLEIAGGPGMIETVRERKPVYIGNRRAFTYVWDQKSFDPVTHNAKYAIHFYFSDATPPLKDAFVYDWRLWTVPELRDVLKEAGFKSSTVYWESEHRGKGTDEYLQVEEGDNSYAWIAYVVGLV